MAAFTATDWRVVATGTATNRNQRVWIEGNTRHIICDITATVGATVAAAGGLIPAPTATQLGFKQKVEYVQIIDENLVTTVARHVKYVKDAHQFRVLTSTASSGIQTPAAAGAVTGTLYVHAVGW
jgi:hypothetical protein